jgi:aminopeptidase N
LNTLRSVINDDDKWYSLLRNYYQHFKYQTIMTTDTVAFFNQRTGLQLRPIFDQYLRHAAIPTLELRFDAEARAVSYRWQVQEKQFAMPVRVGLKSDWQIIKPTTTWQRMSTSIGKDDFDVATDLYYINVSKQ